MNELPEGLGGARIHAEVAHCRQHEGWFLRRTLDRPETMFRVDLWGSGGGMNKAASIRKNGAISETF